MLHVVSPTRFFAEYDCERFVHSKYNPDEKCFPVIRLIWCTFSLWISSVLTERLSRSQKMKKMLSRWLRGIVSAWKDCREMFCHARLTIGPYCVYEYIFMCQPLFGAVQGGSVLNFRRFVHQRRVVLGHRPYFAPFVWLRCGLVRFNQNMAVGIKKNNLKSIYLHYYAEVNTSVAQ